MQTELSELKETLQKIELNDTNYSIRYILVQKAMYLASVLGYKSGVRIDTEEPDWPVYVIDLPTGQVSWHMPAVAVAYDGHTTEEKYKRCRNFNLTVN
jgi:hypothetical protein